MLFYVGQTGQQLNNSVGQVLSNVVQCWPSVAQCWPVWPTLANVVQHCCPTLASLANTGQHYWPNVVLCCPDVVQLLSNCCSVLSSFVLASVTGVVTAVCRYNLSFHSGSPLQFGNPQRLAATVSHYTAARRYCFALHNARRYSFTIHSARRYNFALHSGSPLHLFTTQRLAATTLYRRAFRRYSFAIISD